MMKWTIPVLFFIFLIYLLFFPAQLRPELAFRPAWTVDTARAQIQQTASAEAAAIPFDVGGIFGYVSPEGKLLYRDRKLFGLAIDSTRYINFSSVSESLAVHDKRGRVTGTIESSGYPMLLEHRLFLISTNRAGISERTASGDPIWEREYASVITDLDVQGGITAIGLLDSRLQILDAKGEVTLELDMKGSRINAVYGCALSEDGKSAAVIHGIDPQYLSIVDVTGNTARVADYRLGSGFRTARYVRFFGSDRYLVVEEKEGVRVFDLADDAEHEIPTSGAFADAGVLDTNKFLWVLSGDGNKSEFVVLEPPGRVLFRSVFEGEARAFTDQERTILGVGGRLCALQQEIR